MSDELEFLESILKKYDVPTVLTKLVDTNSSGSSQNEITITEVNSKLQSGSSNYPLGDLDYPLIPNEGDQIRKINYEILHSGWYAQNLKQEIMDFETSVNKAKMIEAGLFAVEKLNKKDFSIFSKYDLELISHSGKKSFDDFLYSNLKLCRHISLQYISPKNKSEVEDIFSFAVFGLIRAVQKWDWTKGFMFSTYASHWIRQSIHRGIDDESNNVRIPTHFMEKIIKNDDFLLWKLKDSNKLLSDENLEVYNLINILSLESFSIEDDSHDLQSNLIDEIELDIRLKDGFCKLIEDEYQSNGSENEIFYDEEFVENIFSFELIKSLLNQLFSVLSDIESKVIILRFGLNGESDSTLDQIGVIFNLTRERIRQIEEKSIMKMKHFLLQHYFHALIVDQYLLPKIGFENLNKLEDIVRKDIFTYQGMKKNFTENINVKDNFDLALSRIYDCLFNPF
jgi:RNA polymerase primary sigma factor